MQGKIWLFITLFSIFLSNATIKILNLTITHTLFKKPCCLQGYPIFIQIRFKTGIPKLTCEYSIIKEYKLIKFGRANISVSEFTTTYTFPKKIVLDEGYYLIELSCYRHIFSPVNFSSNFRVLKNDPPMIDVDFPKYFKKDDIIEVDIEIKDDYAKTISCGLSVYNQSNHLLLKDVRDIPIDNRSKFKSIRVAKYEFSPGWNIFRVECIEGVMKVHKEHKGIYIECNNSRECKGNYVCNRSGWRCVPSGVLSCIIDEDCYGAFCDEKVGLCYKCIKGKCPLNFFCNIENYTCVPGCRFDFNCEEGTICNFSAGKCIPTECEDDRDCKKGFFCTPRKLCKLGCISDFNCPENYACNFTSFTCMFLQKIDNFSFLKTFPKLNLNKSETKNLERIIIFHNECYRYEECKKIFSKTKVLSTLRYEKIGNTTFISIGIEIEISEVTPMKVILILNFPKYMKFIPQIPFYHRFLDNTIIYYFEKLENIYLFKFKVENFSTDRYLIYRSKFSPILGFGYIIGDKICSPGEVGQDCMWRCTRDADCRIDEICDLRTHRCVKKKNNKYLLIIIGISVISIISILLYVKHSGSQLEKSFSKIMAHGQKIKLPCRTPGKKAMEEFFKKQSGDRERMTTQTKVEPSEKKLEKFLEKIESHDKQKPPKTTK